MVQLCKKIVEFPTIQHIDKIVSVAVTMRDSSLWVSKLKGSPVPQLCHSLTRDSCVETPSTNHPDSPEDFEGAHRVRACVSEGTHRNHPV